jgi:hypothetical protein
MSNLFLKNNIRNNSFNNTTESTFNASKILNFNNKISNKNISATSSMIQQSINDLSSTSYDNSQVGGGSVTSSANLSKINSNDINNLLSMLTSESNTHTSTENLENKLMKLLNNQEGGAINTETEMLENKLYSLLNQNGGSYTEDMNTEMLENRINNVIKQSGGGVVKAVAGLAGLAAVGAMISDTHTNTNTNTESDILTNVLGPKPNTTTVVNVNPTIVNPIPVSARSVVDSATSSEMPNNLNMSDTSAFLPARNTNNQNAFITTTSIQKSPTSSEPTNDKRLEQLGGNNPALIAFRELSSQVSKKLGISNGPNAKKIAGQLQRDLKAKMPDITHDKLVKAAMKHLEENLNDYKKMIAK